MAELNDGVRATKRLLGNLGADLLRPRRRMAFTRALLTQTYHWVDGYDVLPTVTIRELFPEVVARPLPMEVRYNYWNITPTELYLLSCLAIGTDPEVIFEFGTYDGATTLQLARCCPEARLHTLDLSPHPDTLDDHFRTGSRFLGTEEEARITQHYGDSRSYDLSDLYGQVDFVFIDGWHDYDVVKRDTANALRMVRPGGMIVWDDFSNWSGVRRAVLEVAERRPVRHLRETRFAVLPT